MKAYYREKKGEEIYLGEVEGTPEEMRNLARYLASYYGTSISWYVEKNKVIYYDYKKESRRYIDIKKWLKEIRKEVRKVVV